MDEQHEAEESAVARDRKRDVTVGFGLTVERGVLARLDRLRACTGKSRSKVAEQCLLYGGLDGMESIHAARIRRFAALARRAGAANWQEYARTYAETYAQQTYPPTVNQLEELEARAEGISLEK